MRAVLQASKHGVQAAFAASRQTRSVNVAARKLIVCEGDRQQQGEASTSQQAAAPAAAPSVRVRPVPGRAEPLPPSPDNLKVERVEKLGESRFSGVVALDSGDTPNDWGRVALLVGGDAAALLLFAAVGRLGHGEPLALSAVLGTAWPFMLGWFGSAAALGGYGKQAQGGDTGAAAGAAAKCWLAGIPAGLLVRAATRGYLPDPSFIAVSMVANGVFLVGWRSALAAATPEAAEPQSRAEQVRARKDRQGNPFEMFQMIFSMVKRW